MSVKRFTLLVLTIISLIPVLFSLINSINQPQVQVNLELYQTNLILQSSEFFGKYSNIEQAEANFNFAEVKKVLIGKTPYKVVSDKYKTALDTSQKNLNRLKNQLRITIDSSVSVDVKDSPITSSKNLVYSANQEQLKTDINSQKQIINKLELELGILNIRQGEISKAIESWETLLTTKDENNLDAKTAIVANILINLWNENPKILSNSELQIQSNLHGWFSYQALTRLYTLQNRQADLISLENKQKDKANLAIMKLAWISIIPVLLGIIGFSLLIFLLAQLLLKRNGSVLYISNKLSWKAPWDAETIWQVLIVGFFFFSQIIFPIVFNFLPFNPTNFSLRQKAFYILASYLSLTLAGIFVLYWSIKSYFPLPKDWFQFKIKSNWLVWGVGGYLVALPLVIIVSLINQQIWDGQGGSNPLLSLALEAQDTVVLAIFYFTASLAAPFYEEIMFRGFLLPSLTRYVPVWAAVTISSFIFALAHLNLSEVLPLAILGMVLGVVYTKSRNLLSSMLVHSLWNSGTLLNLFLLGSSGK
ncbi:MAG: lysostaphin resistance A-like protein [cyanobacterium endosymbiont of Rhopalodia musculus]|uniref:CPBP family intramembrane glutamic endopeptidase n=1 Tax=cyanobacterium endosymbiont of Epithemia clementina EcSB TaxID=3034674 RepID=UPI002480BC32|nr:type II CAAX endopeptidase family protein [cyanobacterium endosymbiont of Epithemia clementina EcSB]WGT68197.1 type II CAAX endopeptidase family protein [cyanobacterium endosymbiont of Epithemia clementina EcSB]